MKKLTDCNLCRYRTNFCDKDYDMMPLDEHGKVHPETDCPGYEEDIFVRDLERSWLKKHLNKTFLVEFLGDILAIAVILPIVFILKINGWF
ncbi:hypothetical protein LI142_22650 [Eubacterium limosum]|uniref:hypothetical protein n=1 Tax=Eubacterium limosum TaxID=1736 RepID=UPI001D05CC7A|nr:hypothetical protein [Eubacterium limosum]MCB6572298.1 hypothetical protein [Eubacterium limosum]